MTDIQLVLAKLLQVCIIENSDGIGNIMVLGSDPFKTAVQHTPAHLIWKECGSI